MCDSVKCTTTRRHHQSEIEQDFKNDNCVLKSIYKNNKQMLEYICKYGNTHYIKYNHFQRGVRCTCAKDLHGIEYPSIVKKKSDRLEEYRTKYKERGFKLTAQKYKSRKTSMLCECLLCSREHFIRPDCLNHASCINCFPRVGNTNVTEKVRDKLSDLYKLSDEKVLDIVSRSGSVLLDKYKNRKTKTLVRCICGTEEEMYIRKEKEMLCRNCNYKNRGKKTGGKKHYKYNSDRCYVDLRKKIHDKCCALLNRCLIDTGQNKTESTEKHLGFTRKELLKHLESFQDFEELKKEIWHLDHIIPVAAFVKNDIKDLKIICNLSNLQPLSPKDNLTKRDKYNKEDFINYLKKFNIILETIVT